MFCSEPRLAQGVNHEHEPDSFRLQTAVHPEPGPSLITADTMGFPQIPVASIHRSSLGVRVSQQQLEMLLLALHIPQPRTPLQFCCPTSPKGAPGAFVENVAAHYTPSTTFRGTLCCKVWTKGYSNSPPAQDPDWLTLWGHSKPSRCHNTADAQSAKLLGSLLPSFVVPG